MSENYDILKEASKIAESAEYTTKKKELTKLSGGNSKNTVQNETTGLLASI
jgi:hypothetical protein